MKMEYARMEYAEKQFKKWARYCYLLSETISPEGVPDKALKKLAQSHRIYNHYYTEYIKSLRESIVETEREIMKKSLHK
jgi:hypothetical protein